MSGQSNFQRNPARRLLLSLAVVLLGAGAAPVLGQSSFLSPLNPIGHHRNGFHLYSTSAYVGYTSLALPQNFSFLNNSSLLGQQFEPDVQAGGAFALGWNHRREQTDFSLTYSASYNGLVRHSEWNTLNHFLSFSSGKGIRLRPRWELSFSGSAGISDYTNFLFTPGLFRQVAGVPANFEDLAHAILGRTFTNDQVAAILTGSPLIPMAESPSRLLLYGNRVFASSLQTTLSYSRSPRFSVHVGGGGSRSQNLRDETRDRGYLLQNATGIQANAGISYGLTPRTQLGAEVSTMRTFSPYLDSYNTIVTASIGRTMGRHWLLRGQGGVGKMTPVRQTFDVARRPTYVAGGSIGVKASGHTFLASHNRTVGDMYGFGSQSSQMTMGAWSWWRPGHGWGLSSSGGYQRLEGSALGFLDGWIVSAGAVRVLGRHTSMNTEYVYANSFGRFAGFSRDLSIHSVRLAFVWTPGPEGFR